MQDNVMLGKKWEFNSEVTNCFEDMLMRSIPQYNIMRDACNNLARMFIKKGTEVIDIGCSRGDAIADLVKSYGATVHFTGIETSQSMLKSCSERFQGWIDCSVVEIKEHDLRGGIPICNASVILSVLTIQFTPIEYRLKILRDIYKSLLSGGAFIFVEKVLGNTSEINDFQVDEYYKLKSNNGYSQDQIERKRLDLEGVLVPLTAKMNEDLLRSVGFSQIDCFWRWMNFAGWVAIKE